MTDPKPLFLYIFTVAIMEYFYVFPYYAYFSFIVLDTFHIFLVDCSVFTSGSLIFIFPMIAV